MYFISNFAHFLFLCNPLYSIPWNVNKMPAHNLQNKERKHWHFAEVLITPPQTSSFSLHLDHAGLSLHANLKPNALKLYKYFILLALYCITLHYILLWSSQYYVVQRGSYRSFLAVQHLSKHHSVLLSWNNSIMWEGRSFPPILIRNEWCPYWCW